MMTLICLSSRRALHWPHATFHYWGRFLMHVYPSPSKQMTRSISSVKGGPPLEKRWELIRESRACGISTQITVSPCLRYSGIENFGQRLLRSGANRLIVDSVTDGDGSGGERTARSPFAQAEPD